MPSVSVEFDRLRHVSGLWGLMKPNKAVNEPMQGACLLLLVWALFQGFSGWWWASAYAAHILYYGVGSAIGSHRYYSHRSFKAPTWFQFAMMFFNTVGHSSAVYFTVAHMNHHKYADTEDDPHAPSYIGWRSFFMWRLNGVKDSSSIRRFASMPWVLWAHNRKNAIILVFALALILIDFRAFLFLWAIPHVTGAIATGTEAYHVHKYGYKTFDAGSSRNVWWLLPLTLGENWHNNHHHSPRRKSNRVKWWEVDPCYWIIRAVETK